MNCFNLRGSILSKTDIITNEALLTSELVVGISWHIVSPSDLNQWPSGWKHPTSSLCNPLMTTAKKKKVVVWRLHSCFPQGENRVRSLSQVIQCRKLPPPKKTQLVGRSRDVQVGQRKLKVLTCKNHCERTTDGRVQNGKSSTLYICLGSQSFEALYWIWRPGKVFGIEHLWVTGCWRVLSHYFKGSLFADWARHTIHPTDLHRYQKFMWLHPNIPSQIAAQENTLQKISRTQHFLN